MVDSPKYSQIRSDEDLKDINRKIVKLGEEFHKPVVATCDVHFLDAEDEVYRRIIMTGKGFGDADSQPPLYLRTTGRLKMPEKRSMPQRKRRINGKEHPL